MKLVFIHGAGATSASFNFILELLNTEYELLFIKYDSENGFKNNLESMKKVITEDKDLFFISHSLGGLYALHLTNHFGDKVKGAVSIATPFNGSGSATLLNFLKPCQLYSDISPYSEPVYSSHRFSVKCPWTQVVTTSGKSHFISEDNDGVVTKKSMTARTDMSMVEINYGHHEVMVAHETVKVIKDSLKLISKVDSCVML